MGLLLGHLDAAVPHTTSGIHLFKGTKYVDLPNSEGLVETTNGVLQRAYLQEHR